MAKHYEKEALFANYLSTVSEVFSNLEAIFNIEGLCDQIFGDHQEVQGNEAAVSEVRNRIYSSGAWMTLSQLFDYAVDGILPDGCVPEEIVIGGAEVLSYIDTEKVGPSDDWHQVVALGDGRFALDTGESLTLDKLALLAKIDTRTVRNAISAGELVASKDGGTLHIDNTSARNWLSGRRAFTPTRLVSDRIADIEDISTPVQFGHFLSEQRKRIGLDSTDSKVVLFHPSVDLKAISDLETGVFQLPLDTVFPLADFYQVDRKSFLDLILRVFFPTERQMLSELLARK